MSLVHTKITDSAISAHIALLTVDRLRDNLNPLLQFRFSSKRTKGYWFVYYRGWKKVGEWPQSKTRDVRNGFGAILAKLQNKQDASVINDCFTTVGDLLTWYEDRKANDAYISVQRKKDIKCAVNKHLLPAFEYVAFDDLTYSFIDSNFIWPLQKKVAKSTVAKLFRTFKTAFYDASNLHRIEKNPLAGMKITDFGDFISKPKGSALQPYMVQGLLDELQEQKPMTKVIVLIMITLGTRIGETRQAKWKNFHFGNESVWLIPKEDTKTEEAHTIYLPNDFAKMLLEWKAYQKSRHYKGPYLFPSSTEKENINSNIASALIQEFSSGEWKSHDLRKCARISWAEQGTDFMVGEKMLNHKLGKMAEAYLDTKVKSLRLTALNRHVEWLKEQNKKAFLLGLCVVQSNDVINNDNLTEVA